MKFFPSLPPRWAKARFNDVAAVIRGITFPASAKQRNPGRGLVRCLRTTNVQDTVTTDDVLYVPKEYVGRDNQWVGTGDILISMANSYELVGKVAYALEQSEPTTFGGFIAAIRANGIDSKFLLYQLRSNSRRAEMRRGASQTVNIANISIGSLSSLDIVIAPEAEQKRIVDAVEAFVSRLDAAAAVLEQAQAKLRAYRASVLKAAVEGRLVPTEAEIARAEQRDYEPADVLLQRILAERRRRWEDAELARLTASGKRPKDEKWKTRYEQPAEPQITPKHTLPKGWCWSTVDSLAGDTTYGTSARTSAELVGGVPVLRMGNIAVGGLRFDDLKYLPNTHADFPELLLKHGDLLFNRTNSAELVGKSAVYAGQLSPCSFASYLIRVRTIDGCDPRWMSIVLNSSFGRGWIASVVSQQVGQANVNGSKLKAFVIPLPPIAEQNRIVAEVERLLSNQEAAYGVVQRDLVRCARLRQSILKWAFEGKLVDQDPNDEPADKLIERIRAERAAKEPVKKTARRRKTRAGE